MSKTLKCVNALLLSVHRNAKGGWANIKFQLTAAVTKSLEWPEMPEGTAEWMPDVDELQATLVELTPNNEELAKHACEFKAVSIGDFQVQRKKKKAGKNSVKADKTITEVMCKIRFTDPVGAATLEQYIQSAARSQMSVHYMPQPVQGEIDGTRVDVVTGEVFASAEQRQAVIEMPSGEGEGPGMTHAEKVKDKKAHEERVKNLRKRIKGE
jgi:hypothetical protein